MGIVDASVAMTDGATRNVDRDIAVIHIVFRVFAVDKVLLHHTVFIHADRTETTSAKDGAEHEDIRDIDCHIATDAASGDMFGQIVSSSAKDVAIPSGDARGAEIATRHLNQSIAKHMAVLAPTENGAIDASARLDFDMGVRHAAELLVLVVGVVADALAAAEDVGIDARHVQRSQFATFHDDRAKACAFHGQACLRIDGANTGKFAAAIDVVAHFASAADIHRGVAVHTALLGIALTVAAPAAAKHIAAINELFQFGSGLGIVGIATVDANGGISSDSDIGIFPYGTALAATVHRAFHPSIASNDDFGLLDVRHLSCHSGRRHIVAH